MSNKIDVTNSLDWLLKQSIDEPDKDGVKWPKVIGTLKQGNACTFELLAKLWPTHISPHFLGVLTNPLMVIFMNRNLEENKNSVASPSDFVDHINSFTGNGVGMLLELTNEFEMCTHCICLWISKSTHIIDCFDPQSSPVQSDALVRDWILNLLPDYTFRLKHQRSAYMCPQYRSAIKRIALSPNTPNIEKTSDRFCEYYCYHYCKLRMEGMTDIRACLKLCICSKKELIDTALVLFSVKVPNLQLVNKIVSTS